MISSQNQSCQGLTEHVELIGEKLSAGIDGFYTPLEGLRVYSAPMTHARRSGLRQEVVDAMIAISRQ